MTHTLERMAGASPFGGMKHIFIILALALMSVSIHAKEAAPMAADEAVEKRMVAISDEMRCLVCQNESLSSSRAELALDLRREIRTLIKQGKSDDEIKEFMVSRYGDFVLYRPPLKATTYLLWFGPFLLLAGAIAGLVVYLRRRSGRAVEAAEGGLSADQRRQAEALLSQNEKSENKR